MKFEINFDHMPEYVLIRTEGEASAHDFDDLLEEIVDSSRWVVGTNQLVDHRELIMKHLTPNNMERIKDIVKKHSEKLGHGRCAFVVKDALGFGIARMYELIGGEGIHNEVRVFYSLEEAVEWLKHQEEFSRATNIYMAFAYPLIEQNDGHKEASQLKLKKTFHPNNNQS